MRKINIVAKNISSFMHRFFSIAIIFTFAFIIQLSFIIFSDIPVQKDAVEYDQIALNILNKKIDTINTFSRTPEGYSYFLALIYKIFGHNFRVVRIIQALLGSYTCIILYLLGRSIFNEKTGLWSAFLLALHPVFFAQSNLILTEGIFIFFFISGIYLFTSGIAKYSLNRFLFSGIFITLALLVKPSFSLFPIFLVFLIAVFYIKDLKQYIKLGAVFLVPVFLLSFTAALYNYSQTGNFNPYGRWRLGNFKEIRETVIPRNVHKEGRIMQQKELIKNYYRRAGIDYNDNVDRDNLNLPDYFNSFADFTAYPRNIFEALRYLWLSSYSTYFNIGLPFISFFADKRLIVKFPFIFLLKLYVLLSSLSVFLFGVLGMVVSIFRHNKISFPAISVFIYVNIFYIGWSLIRQSDLTSRYGVPCIPFLVLFALILFLGNKERVV